MQKRITEYIKKYQMILPGDRVGIGFSGGADSLFLLCCLRDLREELDFSLIAIHINHRLRGQESDADEAFCRSFCQEQGIPLLVFAEDVKAKADQWQVGLEEAGRLVRREIWQKCVETRNLDRIALAHHANDRAETFLYHAARGTSLSGLASIPPVSGNVIHPLLGVERREIEEELRRAGLAWRTDSTNLENEVIRNRIRHQILPLLEQEVNESAVRHIAALAEDLLQADALLKELTAAAEKKYVRLLGQEELLISEEVLQESEYLQQNLYLNCLAGLLGARKDLGRVHLQQIRKLFDLQCGRELTLPGGFCALRQYHDILLYRKSPAAPDDRSGFTRDEKTTSDIRGKGCAEQGGEFADGAGKSGQAEGGTETDISLLESGSFLWGEYEVTYGTGLYTGQKINDFKFTKCFDYDKIKTNLTLRHRQPGDYMILDAAGHQKTLKKLMIDEKIPLRQRDHLPVLASGSRVFWVWGQRISDDCRIDKDTEKVMTMTILHK